MKEENTVMKSRKINTHLDDNLFILSIRKIAENVLLREMKTGKDIKAIAIISPFNNEGKSEISNHLSYEFSGMGCKTLLVSFQRNNLVEVGLEVSSLPYKLPEDCIVKTDIENLDFLSSNDIRKAYGSTVGKTSLHNLLNRLKGKYNRIIIDTDALENDLSGFTAASVSDGIYFVCNRKNMHSRQLKKNYKDLKEMGVNILGIIYNNAEKKTVKKIYIQDGERHG